MPFHSLIVSIPFTHMCRVWSPSLLRPSHPLRSRLSILYIKLCYLLINLQQIHCAFSLSFSAVRLPLLPHSHKHFTHVEHLVL
eukprot:c23673_g1_i1 orf=1290-1538(+)